MSDNEESGGRTETVDVTKLRAEFAELARERPTFLVLTGVQIGAAFGIEGEEATIGRADACAIRLSDEGISRRHARIFREGDDSVVIEDLGSSNGTLVNGEVVKRQVLRDGDKITIGASTLLKFTYVDQHDVSFQDRMREAALVDALTGAYNRGHLMRVLDSELSFANRHGTELSLLMFDVDHFKRVNDGFGHLAGDHVLRTLGALVKRTIRAEDIFGRYGGEEFTVVARGVNLAAAGVFAERLRRLVEAHAFTFESRSIPVTISLGVTNTPTIPAPTAAALLADADRVLYQAKKDGRNRVCLSERAEK